ncbi:serine/threonine-protein kinase [Kitasatospora sp. NPDC050543]|uniref:serine/threonine-protein kinase n=1 Tax=Kitasatospora sp. NPDC050543 TaxID=3364054 RepID=UPI0037B77975
MTQAQGSTGRLLAGRYRLNAVLGRGGMGTVWRAEDEMLGRIVAVKELRMHGGVDEDEKHRLIVRTLREAKATARIRHTAAVTVFDVVEEDERPWIVMELVESRSLAEVIKEDGPLQPVRAAEIALDLLGVLGAAHSHGILHRDVKPSNVLIGEDGRVVLTDFGIASVEGDTSVTSTGMLVGAPSYISPERARGHKPGPPADLWSLGGTLYAMVEGKPPYDRGSALATLTAVMTEDLGTPLNAGPLRPVIEGLLEKDPAQRLDASATRSMLKRIVADATGRAEATTQQAVPVAPAAKQEPAAEQAPAAKDAGKPASTGQTSDSPVAAAQEPAKGAKGADEGSAGGAKRPGGLLGTVRVGSRARDEGTAAPAAPAATVPAEATGGPVAAPRAGEWSRGETLPLGGRRRKAVLVAAVVLVLVLIAGAVALVKAFSGSNAAAGRTGSGSVTTASENSAAGASAATSSGASGAAGTGAATTGATASSGTSAGPGQTASESPSPSTAQTPSQGAAPTPGQSTATTPAATPTQATTPAAPPTTAVKAGYHEYRDPSGFSIVLPDWLKESASTSNRRTFKANGSTLVIEWTTSPGKSALADWQSSEPGLMAQVTNYQRVALQAVTYRQWTNAADWEWISGANPRTHSLNRGFVTGEAKYGYAIYWTVPVDDWSGAASTEARQTSYDTFQPAP